MSDFIEHIEEASRIVAGWSKWKRDVLQLVASEPDGDTERTTRRWLLSVQCDETTNSVSVFANDHSKPLSLADGESILFEHRSGVTLKLSRIDTRPVTPEWLKSLPDSAVLNDDGPITAVEFRWEDCIVVMVVFVDGKLNGVWIRGSGIRLANPANRDEFLAMMNMMKLSG